MTLWAIIPVKPLQQGKSRLAGVLSVPQRAGLMATLLQHTLAVLRQVEGVDQVAVISSDPAVWEIAREQAVWVIEEKGVKGLNTAVSQAVVTALHHHASSTLIMPADLPLLQPTDVQTMLHPLQTASQPLMVICSDVKNDGTNALLLAPPGNFAFHYGPGSFQHHLRVAHHLKLATHIVGLPHLQFDLDTEADWHNYQVQMYSKSVFPIGM